MLWNFRIFENKSPQSAAAEYWRTLKISSLTNLKRSKLEHLSQIIRAISFSGRSSWWLWWTKRLWCGQHDYQMNSTSKVNMMKQKAPKLSILINSYFKNNGQIVKKRPPVVICYLLMSKFPWSFYCIVDELN